MQSPSHKHLRANGMNLGQSNQIEMMWWNILAMVFASELQASAPFSTYLLGELSAKLIGLQCFSEAAEWVDVKGAAQDCSFIFATNVSGGVDQMKKIRAVYEVEHLQH